MKMLNNERTKLIQQRMRKNRFSLFLSLLSNISHPVNILDVGGTQLFWEKMGYVNHSNVKITLLNLEKNVVKYPNFKSVVGNATDMSEFNNNEFDVVFSNSVIEHVGDYKSQQKMAYEVKRVGKRYFIQTPNYYFPIEPHYRFPFVQFIPIKLNVFLIKHVNMGRLKKIKDTQKAYAEFNRIRLLKKNELKELFPGAKIYHERYFGVTKSFIAYYGFE